MNQSKSNFFNALILFFILTGFAFSQELIQGSITYIAQDNAYTDLGKKQGLEKGDTLTVVQDKKTIGLAIITSISGATSALLPLDSTVIDWQIGDVVQYIRPKIKEVDVKNIEQAIVVTSPKPTQVFLDSSAYKPRERSGIAIDESRFSPTFTGYLSARVDDRGSNKDSINMTTTSLYGRFQANDIGIKYLSANLYVRGNQSSTNNLINAQIYSLMLSYKNPNKPVSYLMGRMYHPQFSMLGTVDGLGLTWKMNKRLLALLGGKQATFSNITPSNQRLKFSILDEETLEKGYVQVGSIIETLNGNLDRNYLLVATSLKFNKKLRLNSSGEFDLDLFDKSKALSLISLTRFRASLKWRMGNSISSNFRYSYRENVINLLDTSSVEPNLAVRHSLNVNISWISHRGFVLSGQASYRSDFNGRNIQTYGLTYNQQSFTSNELSLNAGTMLLLSYMNTGGRVHASVSKKVKPWLYVDAYDELFMYKILGDSVYRTRHLPEIGLSARINQKTKFRFSYRLEQEGSTNFYRMGLNASRQF